MSWCLYDYYKSTFGTQQSGLLRGMASVPLYGPAWLLHVQCGWMKCTFWIDLKTAMELCDIIIVIHICAAVCICFEEVESIGVTTVWSGLLIRYEGFHHHKILKNALYCCNGHTHTHNSTADYSYSCWMLKFPMSCPILSRNWPSELNTGTWQLFHSVT